MTLKYFHQFQFANNSSSVIKPPTVSPTDLNFYQNFYFPHRAREEFCVQVILSLRAGLYILFPEIYAGIELGNMTRSSCSKSAWIVFSSYVFGRWTNKLIVYFWINKIISRIGHASPNWSSDFLFFCF